MAFEEISIQLAKLLDGYSKEIQDAAKDEIEAVAKETAQRLKETSPKRMKGRKHYANGWRVTKEGRSWIVHNANKPRLTALLEKGHAIANQKGKLPGRVPAQPHIAPAEEWAADELVRRIEERLNKL